MFLGVQPKSIAAFVLHPEGCVKELFQGLDLLEQLPGACLIAQHGEDFGHARLGIVDIALQFTQRFGLLDLAAIGIDHRVLRIFPAHVLVAT